MPHTLLDSSTDATNQVAWLLGLTILDGDRQSRPSEVLNDIVHEEAMNVFISLNIIVDLHGCLAESV